MRLLLIATLTFATTLAYGEPAVVAGLGTQPCADLTARTRTGFGYAQNGLAGAAFSWVQGYVSAWNAVELVRAGRFADLTSLTFDEQWARIAEFCRKNPDGFVFDAAQNLIATGLKLQIALPMTSGSAAHADIDGSTKSR